MVLIRLPSSAARDVAFSKIRARVEDTAPDLDPLWTILDLTLAGCL
jgi:hypothetical protein